MRNNDKARSFSHGTAGNALRPGGSRLQAVSLACAIACLAAAGGVAVPAAHAQGGTAQAAWAASRSLNLPAQPLGQSLNALARTWGVAVAADASLVQGRMAPALQGPLTLNEALGKALAGSGLEAVPEGAAITVQRVGNHTRALGEVRVTAQAQQESTEGTGSYAASHVSLGKGQDLRETPQSISVVTRQRIEDQALASVGEVMQQTTGVTVNYAGAGGLGGMATSFLSRGFEIGNVQIDGASVDAFSQQLFDPNLAMYDSVQIVRGANGLFSGNGEPGGAINLVRKRPTAQKQILGAVGIGSWSRRQAELDVAGPLNEAGTLRGRAVLAHTGKDFFYRGADAQDSLLYGILEADVGSASRVTVGASHGKLQTTPWREGIPRAPNGDDLKLPRSTALMAGWSHYDKSATELFAQWDQQIAGDWKLKAQVNLQKVDSDARLASLTGTVDPATGLGANWTGFSNDFRSEKKGVDVHASGPFSLLGRRHKLLVGADWTRVRDDQDTFYSEMATPASLTNVYEFDPGRIPAATSERKTRSYPGYGATQKAVYGRANLSLTDQLTAIVGGRYAGYAYDTPYINYTVTGGIRSSGHEHYSESGIFTPYAGLVYDLGPQWTAYGSVTEIHKSQANMLAGPLPGKPLDPIKGRSVELGMKGELADGKLNTAFALYRIERTGQAARDPGYPETDVGSQGLSCCYVAQGKIVSQGVDMEVSGQLARGWQLFAGYTYNHNRNKTDPAQLVYSSITPKHLFKLWSTYQLPGEFSPWTLGGGVTLQSATYVSGTVNRYNPASGKYDGAALPFRFTQAGYAVWNASVQYRINRHWSASLNLNNMFDKTYYKAVGSIHGGNWYGEPRSALLMLRGSF